jgi:hypothetical protein
MKTPTVIMKSKNILTILTLSALLFSGCGMGKLEEKANQQFGDQHFKTAIALIELHKVRFGEYPETLDSLKFTGDWDQIIFSSVKYQKLDKGYELDLTNGWMGKPDFLEYPDEFWKGLGLVRSNMKR